MKAIILEDEIVAAKRLHRLIVELDEGIEILQSFESVLDTAEYLLHHPAPDLLFLDIQVMDGLSFELFNVVEISSPVIFITAYDEYAVEAFRKNAIDYLLKPIKKEDLSESISRVKSLNKNQVQALENTLSKYKNRFLIKFGVKLHSVAANEIAFIYSENKISYFVTNEGKKIASDFKLQDLITQMNPKYFFRVNRQFIIHISSIKEMISYSKSRIKLRLSPAFDGDIVVSTETTPKFKNWLNY